MPSIGLVAGFPYSCFQLFTGQFKVEHLLTFPSYIYIVWGNVNTLICHAINIFSLSPAAVNVKASNMERAE